MPGSAAACICVSSVRVRAESVEAAAVRSQTVTICGDPISRMTHAAYACHRQNTLGRIHDRWFQRKPACSSRVTLARTCRSSRWSNAMNTSRMLVAISCAALLLGGAPAAFAQRGGGGHGGGGGGFHGGGGGFHGGGGGFHGGGMSMMGHGGGVRGMSLGPVGARGFNGANIHPFIHGGNGPFVRGGFVHGGNFVQHGAF